MADLSLVEFIGLISSSITITEGTVLIHSLMSRDKYLLRNVSKERPEEELSIIRSKLAKFIPERQLRSLAQMSDIFSRNPSAYQIMESVRLGKTSPTAEIAGGAICYPLTGKFCNKLIAGKADASAIEPKYLAKHSSSGIYLGFAWGNHPKSQGYLCRALSCTWAGAGKIPLFTRPTTNEALRFVRKNGFQRVGGGTPEEFSICWRSEPIPLAPSRILIQKIL